MGTGLTATVDGARHISFGPIEIEVGSVGDARIKRMTYPPGMRWSSDVQPLVGTERCEHAHAGYLAQGAIRFEFGDGCVEEFTAPALVQVAPGHDAEIFSDEPAILIEVDFEADTIGRLGLADRHAH